MRTYRLRSKREAVDFALRHARRPKPLEPNEFLALLGTNFMDPDFDLDALRAMRNFDDPAENERSA